MYTMSCQVMATVFLLVVVGVLEVVEVVRVVRAFFCCAAMVPPLSRGAGDHVHSLRPQGDLG